MKATPSCASFVEAPRCGVETTSSSATSACSADGGSSPHTSSDAPDASQSDDAQSLPAQLDADELLSLPAPRLQARVPLRDAARERKQEGQRVLGGRHRVAVRRVHHDDARFGRRHHVDVVNAHARAPYHAQTRETFQKLRRHLRLAPNDESVRPAQSLREFLAPQARALLYIEPRGAQRLKPALVHVVCDENFYVRHPFSVFSFQFSV